MNKKLLFLSALTILVVPIISLAQPGAVGGTIVDVVNGIVVTVLTILWSISIAFVVIMFSLAGFKFLTAQGESSKISEARIAVIWGTVGVAVIVLAWSMIVIIRLQFGV